MKKNLMRLPLLLMATLLLLGTFVGCIQTNNKEMAALLQNQIDENKQLRDDIAAAQADLAAAEQERDAALAEASAAKAERDQAVAKSEAIAAQPPEVKTLAYATGVNCKINGEDKVEVNGETKLVCTATLPEGFVVDYWVVDGEDYDTSDPELTITVSGPVTVEAVLRLRKIVTCIDCHLQFVNDKKKAEGDTYETFDFEDDYTNPVTKEEVKGGTIECYIIADVPRGEEVAYWMINGVEYHFENKTVKFRVTDLDEATVYQPVFAKNTTTYCKVTCTNCMFSGGGYTNATSGKVPVGTTITVTAKYLEGRFDATPSAASYGTHTGTWSAAYGSYIIQYQYTVTSDTSIRFYEAIN